ncbi:hypothetical protein BT96DRAFT_926639 [Gymnopus androsaceus JB14]|uniref:Uncharacterized protein n=1 Tax=Gymnopus androsaceus JB14 TaxID=1447944 RepID=A0A6A4GTZ0_9AGAR|nr:hypothetical protein BT96DRAFT_926639 [Gymnopus androsaceus JB14]
MDHPFSATNLASHYRAVTNTMTNLQELSADYVDLLQTDVNRWPDIVPSQTYDYADLNAFAASAKSSAIGQGGTDANNGDSNGNNNNNNGNDDNGNGGEMAIAAVRSMENGNSNGDAE